MTQTQHTPEQWTILPGTTVGGELGTFSVDFVIRHRDGIRARTLRGVVDTGASYTVIPAPILDELDIEREKTRTFNLADGSKRDLATGWVQMELEEERDNVQVVFGPDDRKVLLGAMALETFALAADAKNRRLIPAELTI